MTAQITGPLAGITVVLIDETDWKVRAEFDALFRWQ